MGACVVLNPSSFQEAVQQLTWVDAMVEEYDSIVRNNVWDEVPRLEDKSVVSSCWLYKVKKATNGSVEKHKARFVACGVSQQAPRAWYTKIVSYFTGLGFTKSEANVNLYHIVVEGKLWIIVLYVDDLILIGDEKLIKYCKEALAREFEMKDMGLMHYFLGMEVWQRDGKLFVSQGNYANEILRRFRMERSQPMETPLAGKWRKEDATLGEVVEAIVYRQIVGSLMFGEHTTRYVLYS
eukprot:PITA_13901